MHAQERREIQLLVDHHVRAGSRFASTLLRFDTGRIESAASRDGSDVAIICTGRLLCCSPPRVSRRVIASRFAGHVQPRLLGFRSKALSYLLHREANIGSVDGAACPGSTGPTSRRLHFTARPTTEKALMPLQAARRRNRTRLQPPRRSFNRPTWRMKPWLTTLPCRTTGVHITHRAANRTLWTCSRTQSSSETRHMATAYEAGTQDTGTMSTAARAKARGIGLRRTQPDMRRCWPFPSIKPRPDSLGHRSHPGLPNPTFMAHPAHRKPARSAERLRPAPANAALRRARRAGPRGCDAAGPSPVPLASTAVMQRGAYGKGKDFEWNPDFAETDPNNVAATPCRSTRQARTTK